MSINYRFPAQMQVDVPTSQMPANIDKEIGTLKDSADNADLPVFTIPTSSMHMLRYIKKPVDVPPP